MNKLFTKIVGAALGLTMAIGVGVAVASNSKEATPVYAADQTVTWSPAAASELGTAFTTFTAGGTKTGNVSSGSYSWSWTRTYMSGTKDHPRCSNGQLSHRSCSRCQMWSSSPRG